LLTSEKIVAELNTGKGL